MITKHEMDIIRNLAAKYARPSLFFEDLVSEAVQRILEEKERVGIANDGIFIAIATRAMKDYEMSTASPVFIPSGSLYYVCHNDKPIRMSLREIEKIRGGLDPDTKYTVYEAMEEARKIINNERLYQALVVECWTVPEIVEEFTEVTFYALVKLKARIKEVFRRLGLDHENNS